jgi:hypothetical protein
MCLWLCLWPVHVEGNDVFDMFVATCVQRHRGITQQCFSILSSSLSLRMTTPHFPLIVASPTLGTGSRILSRPSAPPMEVPERSTLAKHPPNVSPPAPGSSWTDWSHMWGREAYLNRALKKLNLEYPRDSDD